MRDLLHVRFIEVAKRRWSSLCMADSTGKELNYGQALIATLLLTRRLRKACAENQKVGLLLPSSVGGALANIALLLAGHVPVNLNFTAAQEAVDSAIRQCGIQTIITSKLFLAQSKIERVEGMVFLEDLLKEITPSQRIVTTLTARLLPRRLLGAMACPEQLDSESLATVIFSSGSTGLPKGVMLSHQNILSNVEAVAQVFALNDADRMLGVVPFFHAFGFTMTLWLPLTCGLGAIYHTKPLDAKTIGELCSRYRAAILCSTPTFYHAYVRGCLAEAFSSLRYALAGAEKLRESIAIAFKKKFGLDLLEGYGCTEMAPVVSVNLPDPPSGDPGAGFRTGTVGRPIPGVSVKIVNSLTGNDLPAGQQGLLLARGPNRMIGYLGQPERTAEVLRDGWYVTGDIASVDEDGFVTILDRLSRFSKVGGEMVPHLKIEETVNQILGDHGCVVTSVPDEQKGERLAVFYTQKQTAPEELWDSLKRTHLPKLWIPKKDDIHRIDSIPLLGSGKIDLKKIKTMALEMEGR